MRQDVGREFKTGEEGGETIQVSVDLDPVFPTQIKIDHVGQSIVQQWVFLTPEAAETLALRLQEAARRCAPRSPNQAAP